MFVIEEIKACTADVSRKLAFQLKYSKAYTYSGFWL